MQEKQQKTPAETQQNSRPEACRNLSENNSPVAIGRKRQKLRSLVETCDGVGVVVDQLHARLVVDLMRLVVAIGARPYQLPFIRTTWNTQNHMSFGGKMVETTR